MSQIDQLIAQLCPHGVHFKTLGDTGTFIRGNGLQKKDFADSGVGCIHYGQIHTYYGTWATRTVTFVSPALSKRLRRARTGDLVIATTSEDDAAVGKAVAWLGAEEAAVSGDAYIYRHSLDPKYVAYFFQSEQFSLQKKRYITGTKVRRISGESLARIRIPVPPMEVQREIVRVLDNFAELEAKLEAELEVELETRRNQYSYYRNTLLTSGEQSVSEQASWRTLSEFAEFRYGFTASARQSGSYRFIRITDITERGKLSPTGCKYVNSTSDSSDYLVEPGDLLVARTGGTFGKTVLITDTAPAVFASFLIRVRVNEKVLLPGFYWHFAQSTLYWEQAENLASRGGQPQFNANVLRVIKLPLHSLEEQHRIVAILDKYDDLVNDISGALRTEIGARRRQYEHYRDRLFAFREAA